MTDHSRLVHAWFRFAWSLLRGRYGLDRVSGRLFLVGAIIDPFIYAGIVYFMLSAVFEFQGFDRFQFLSLGAISFRWTLSCVFDSASMTPFRNRLREVDPSNIWAPVLAVMLPPTLVMMLSMVASLVMSIAVADPAQHWTSIALLPAVILFHGIWNTLAVLALDTFRRRTRLRIDLALAVVAGMLWVLSPVMYRFDDIPAQASLIFTSLNPVSHVLAAYYNSYWYGLAVSAELLPAAAVLGLVGIVLLQRRNRSLVNKTVSQFKFETSRGPVLIISDAHSETGATDDSAYRFQAWDGEPRGYTGGALVSILLNAWGLSRRGVSPSQAEIREKSRVGRLFEDDLAIYPDWALSQLALAMAIRSGGRSIVLDGVLDAADLTYLHRIWPELEEEVASGRNIAVITRRLLPLPNTANGRFVALQANEVVREGSLGKPLEDYYADVIGRSR